MNPGFLIGLIFVLLAVFILIPAIVALFLRDVAAGTIRIVTWWGGATRIYRGPGKSYEIPLLTNGTSLSSKAINVDLDITDQTADIDNQGVPQPIKVRVLASAIVSVGDTEGLIRTAANRFFAKANDEQMSTLIDLLSSSGRRAVNLLTHDQLFSAKTAPRPGLALPAPTAPEVLDLVDSRLAVEVAEDDDDPLAIIIRKACSRELTDLGLIFNSLNIKVVQSEVADARRRMSAAEAAANAEIVAAQQTRRAREAQLEAARVISDRERELDQTRIANAVLIAQAEAQKQDALAGQRESELKATQIAEALANAEAIRINAEASAQAEAIRITTVADANAASIRKLAEAIAAGGGENFFRYRQIEMLPELAPHIAAALAQARLVTIHSGGDDPNGGGAAGATADSIAGVIRTVLAAQLVSRDGGLLGGTAAGNENNGSASNGR